MSGLIDAPSRPTRPQAEIAGAGVGATDGPSSGEASLKLLLADDHPMNRKLVSLMLSFDGFALTSVEDGAAAVEAFQAERFDVVLMDMQMPVMDGLCAIRAIRAWEQSQGRARTPILALTAHALPEHARAALAAGADGRLVKPITSAALLAGVEAALNMGASAVAQPDAEPLRAVR